MNTIKAGRRMLGPRVHLPSCQSAHNSYEQRKILKLILAHILVIEDRTDVFEPNFIPRPQSGLFSLKGRSDLHNDILI
jgi:hypothetical protein